MVLIQKRWVGLGSEAPPAIFYSEFQPKFWVFPRISAKILGKILPQKARNHDIRDKKARKCDIRDNNKNSVIATLPDSRQ